MEFWWHDLGPLNRNVFGQQGIGATYPGGNRSVYRGVKVHYLHQAVHTGIGAASAEGRDLVASELAQGDFQLVLYGLPGQLALPTLVVAPVVADAHRQSEALRRRVGHGLQGFTAF